MKNRRSVRLCVEVLESRVGPSTFAPPATPPAPYVLWGSSNWSGISLNTAPGAVTSVSASWFVPAVTGSDAGYSSTWVGIDGDISSTVEQIGTESDTAYTAAHDGTPQYYAWYEMYPAGYHYTTPTTVSPGDQITASVVYAGQTKTGTKINDNYTLTISDSTPSLTYPQGWTFSTVQSVPNHKIGQRNSAEWIQEAPSGGGVLPLANFGSVTFTNARATISNVNGTIASFVGNPSVVNYGTAANPLEINLIDMGTFTRSGQWTSIKDETSLLSASGDSFTVQFGSSNPSAPSGALRTKGPNGRVTDAGEATFAVAEFAQSPPGNVRVSAFRDQVVAVDARQPEVSYVVPNTAAPRAPSTHIVEATSSAMGSTSDAVFEVAVATANPSAPTNSPWFTSPIDATTATLLPNAVATTAVWEAPHENLPVPSQSATDSQPSRLVLDGTADQSALALFFVAGLVHSWNRAAITEEDAMRARRSAKMRLPLIPA